MIYLFMVGRNEEDRWLHACLEWNTPVFDRCFFYDDQSDDNTVKIASQYCNVRIRPDDVPSFLEHEGKFKQAAWEAFETRYTLTEDDWVMVLDCDEFLMAPHPKADRALSVHDGILSFCETNTKHDSLMVRIPEVWDVSQATPKIRLDGYWNSNSAPRLFRYKPNSSFDDKAMGCGCAPTYAYSNAMNVMYFGVILHFGYALEEDRVAKYERYTSLQDHGHNEGHIQSIVQPATLGDIGTEIPHVWRGTQWQQQ